jgi:hypothetical protein
LPASISPASPGLIDIFSLLLPKNRDNVYRESNLT